MPVERYRVPVTYPDTPEVGGAVYATEGGLTVIDAGTAGDVLTSNGAGTPPSWQASSGGGAASSLAFFFSG